MLLKNCYFLYIILTLIIDATKAAKCDEFYCHDNSECKYNKDTEKMYCVCEEGYNQEIKDKNIYCNKNDKDVANENKKEDILKISEDPVENKERDFGIVKTSVEPVKTIAGEELNCLNLQLKCGNKCCAEGEKCNDGNKCVLEVVVPPLNVALTSNCPESQKCKENCCANIEVCNQEYKCVPKITEEAAIELLSNEVAQKYVKVTEPSNIIDLLQNEVTQEDNAKLLSNEEIEEGINHAVHGDITDIELPSIGVSKDVTTYLAPKGTTTESSTSSNEGEIELLIPEIIEESNNTVKYLSTTIQTTAEPIEFAQNLQTTCPPQQKCLDNCCLPLEICNEFNKCINKSLDDISHLYDFSQKHNTSNTEKTSSDFDSVIDVYDFNAINNCASDQQPCQHKCCSAQETCNELGQCVEKINDIICDPEGNCVEIAEIAEKVTTTKTSLTYMILGLGCLVLALAFGLFKVYDFRRFNRNLY